MHACVRACSLYFCVSKFFWVFPENLISLVIRSRTVNGRNAETTIVHQDLWLGKLVPSSHKRSGLSNTIIRIFGICLAVSLSGELRLSVLPIYLTSSISLSFSSPVPPYGHPSVQYVCVCVCVCVTKYFRLASFRLYFTLTAFSYDAFLLRRFYFYFFFFFLIRWYFSKRLFYS